ncbi:MAG: hypothetical protein AAF502_25140 [Bacteroidota bacterium]
MKDQKDERSKFREILEENLNETTDEKVVSYGRNLIELEKFVLNVSNFLEQTMLEFSIELEMIKAGLIPQSLSKFSSQESDFSNYYKEQMAALLAKFYIRAIEVCADVDENMSLGLEFYALHPDHLGDDEEE